MFADIENEMVAALKQEFEPIAEYDSAGDCIEFFAENVPFNGMRLDDWVTMYVAEDNGRLIGCLIKRVRRLLASMPGLQEIIISQDNKMRLDYFFVASAARIDDRAVIHKYNELRQVSGEMVVPIPCAVAA